MRLTQAWKLLGCCNPLCQAQLSKKPGFQNHREGSGAGTHADLEPTAGVGAPTGRARGVGCGRCVWAWPSAACGLGQARPLGAPPPPPSAWVSMPVWLPLQQLRGWVCVWGVRVPGFPALGTSRPLPEPWFLYQAKEAGKCGPPEVPQGSSNATRQRQPGRGTAHPGSFPVVCSTGALSRRGHGLGGPALGIQLRAAGSPHLSLIGDLCLHSQSLTSMSRGMSFSPRGPEGLNSSVKCLPVSWKNYNQKAVLPGYRPVSSLKASRKEHSKSLVLGGLAPPLPVSSPGLRLPGGRPAGPVSFGITGLPICV